MTPRRRQQPPLSKALRQVMIITGISGMDLARALDVSQSAVSRYYNDREPDYEMVLRIEKALNLPRGSLFSLAGYCPASAPADSLAAVMVDDTLTDGQKFSILYPLLEALKERRGSAPPEVDTLVAIQQDGRLSTQRRRMLAAMVEGYRTENQERSRTPRRKAASR